MRDGFSDFSYIHGQAFRFSSKLNQYELQMSMLPSDLIEGSHPPMPTLVSEACASTLGVDLAGNSLTSHE